MIQSIIEQASIIPPLTEINEREELIRLAKNVPDKGLIVEIGCLYGGTTAVLSLANPNAKIIAIDDFSWHPEGYPVNSPELVYGNLHSLGIDNVKVMKGDSRVIGKKWKEVIDLLWIDGGHSYQYVYSDLINFAPHAWVVALHDYDNPAWASIRQAVEVFLNKYKNEWYLDKVVGMVCVLRRR